MRRPIVERLTGAKELSLRKKPLSILLLLSLLWLPALAQDEPQATVGPAKIDLAKGQAELALPKGFSFFDKATTSKILKEGGNSPDGKEAGIIFMPEEEDFFVLVGFDPMGYVKDDDAGDIDPAELLESYKEGTEAQNEEREKLGIPAMHVTGWGQEPAYDAKDHHLVWALSAESAGEPIVNFETRVLGREGVLTMTLACNPKNLAKYKPKVDELLAATKYKEGKRYADFKEGDKVSEAGLLALVMGGAAAAKLGLFGKLLKMLVWLVVIFKKFIILIPVAIYGLFKKLTGRGDSTAEPLPVETPPAAPPSDPPSDPQV